METDYTNEQAQFNKWWKHETEGCEPSLPGEKTAALQGWYAALKWSKTRRFCDDCGCEFPPHEDYMPDCIKEALNEVTTCGDCCGRQLEEAINADSKRLWPAVRRRLWWIGYKTRNR